MKPTRRRRGSALILSLAVAGVASLAGTLAVALPASAAAPASAIDVAPDYLSATYGLPADHVFETVTVERFEWLLNGRHEDNATNVTGRFAFFIGGTHDENTAATIGHVNEVAKQYGVERIYTFDPALDGKTLNVWDTGTLNLAPEGKAPLEAIGSRLKGHLNADTTPAFDGTSSDPYLFVYDRSRTVGGAEDRIVSSLNVRRTSAELASPSAVVAYKAQVAAVFDAIAVSGSAHVDQLDQFAFWKAETNRRHRLGYPNAATHGGSILTDSDATAGWRVKTITYPELEHLVKQDGDYVILFGGTWCHNTRAVIKQVNREAQRNGVPTVYNFDNSLDSTGNAGTNYLHIRDNAAATAGALPKRASYLYGDLWNTYFPNVVTQYRTATSEAWSGSVSPVQFHPRGDTSQPLQLARKGQVPFLFEYDKGAPAPVVSQWIRTNAPGAGWTEYMTEWWLTPTGGQLSGNDQAKAFGAAAEAALVDFFAALPTAAATTPSAPAAPTATVTGSSVTIAWTAPADGGSAITGYGVSLDGGEPALVGGDTLSHVFTDVAPGTHTATVVATNQVGSSPASAPSNPVTVVAGVPQAPAAPAVVADGSTLHVSWSAPSDGGSAITGYLVSLNGEAPVSVPAGTTAHTFASVAAGVHRATVAAVNEIGAGEASPASAKAYVATGDEQLEVTGSVVPGGTVTVTGSGFAPGTAGLDVELHSTPQHLASVVADGGGGFAFTAALPADAAPGEHRLVVLLDGVEVHGLAVTVGEGPAAGDLAATGLAAGATAAIAGAAVLIVLLGTATLVIARRRRQRSV